MMGTHFDWDEVEDNIVAELDDDGNAVATYTTEPTLYGNVISQHRDGQTSYFHHDGIGNTITVTNDNGDVTDTRAYSAFGEITESTGSTEFPFQFVGQKGYYRDEETGEYSVRARPYEPVVARWKSVDPLFAEFAMNLYYYAALNPLRFIDPSGKKPSVYSPTPDLTTFAIEFFFRMFFPPKVPKECCSSCVTITILIKVADDKGGHTGIAIGNEYFDFGPEGGYGAVNVASGTSVPGTPWWDNPDVDLDDIIKDIEHLAHGKKVVKVEISVCKEQADAVREYWKRLYDELPEYRIPGLHCTSAVCMSQQIQPQFDDDGNIIGYLPPPLVDLSELPIPGSESELHETAALSPAAYLKILSKFARNSCGPDKGKKAKITTLVEPKK